MAKDNAFGRVKTFKIGQSAAKSLKKYFNPEIN